MGGIINNFPFLPVSDSNKRKTAKAILGNNPIKIFNKREFDELLNSKIVSLIVGFEPFLDLVNSFEGYFTNSAHCFHSSILLKAENDENIMVEYGPYQGQIDLTDNRMYYFEGENEDGFGARFCYMTKNEYISKKIKDSKYYIKCDINIFGKTLKEIYSNINDLNNRWACDKYRVNNHNCQDFVVRILKYLRCTQAWFNINNFFNSININGSILYNTVDHRVFSFAKKILDTLILIKQTEKSENFTYNGIYKGLIFDPNIIYNESFVNSMFKNIIGEILYKTGQKSLSELYDNIKFLRKINSLEPDLVFNTIKTIFDNKFFNNFKNIEKNFVENYILDYNDLSKINIKYVYVFILKIIEGDKSKPLIGYILKCNNGKYLMILGKKINILKYLNLFYPAYFFEGSIIMPHFFTVNKENFVETLKYDGIKLENLAYTIINPLHILSNYELYFEEYKISKYNNKLYYCYIKKVLLFYMKSLSLVNWKGEKQVHKEFLMQKLLINNNMQVNKFLETILIKDLMNEERSIEDKIDFIQQILLSDYFL